MRELADASRARGTADWLSLAATPSFALLALLSGPAIAPDVMCLHGSSPIGSMQLMYGLMAVFHLPCWLRVLGRR